jgi:hypothetical protein
MKVKISFSQTTCGTKARTETSSCGKLVVPGLGEFVATECTLDESTLTPECTEFTTVHYGRYRNTGCGESYHMYVKLHFKVCANGTEAHCESMDIDCAVPCCGNT